MEVQLKKFILLQESLQNAHKMNSSPEIYHSTHLFMLNSEGKYGQLTNVEFLLQN